MIAAYLRRSLGDQALENPTPARAWGPGGLKSRALPCMEDRAHSNLTLQIRPHTIASKYYTGIALKKCSQKLESHAGTCVPELRAGSQRMKA